MQGSPKHIKIKAIDIATKSHSVLLAASSKEKPGFSSK
jgi:hypothetical protein